jgi:cytochrome o ubiquinol oxidase subunit 1
MVWATIVIMILSFTVWLHHFFTMGAGGDVNAFFGVTTMLIAIPTGVKMFNWLFTMYRGRVRFTTPMLWTIGFMITFTTGGMTGVLLAVPGADFVLHNSLFLIAHFHSMLIGGTAFGVFAGVTYWFPKAFGFTLNEKLGKRAFWSWIIGFYVAFMPLYVLGFMGMTRRLNHYDNPAYRPWLIIAAVGAVIILVGIIYQVAQLAVSIRDRKKNNDLSGDPWDGRTLEWSTSSPPPFYNFAKIPVAGEIDAFWEMKQSGEAREKPSEYAEIHMPKNTAAGVFIGAFALAFGFGLVWHIWWMAIVGFLGIIATMIVRTSNYDIDYFVPAAEVKRIEDEHSQHMAQGA